eukprot:CAMPEP_0174242142 /NCGR_PEP_ID=MMETSP0417-20130205/26574_1 /TAXON_ID=242541 /ORGANISM="Mayorella sp, Strain BSH-02190019" /LENGTH=678 /DNA_ID=CAMNT_0015321501 /DNA_START=26 /DNA_END=2062 /DNA_ORIENTATION=-
MSASCSVAASGASQFKRYSSLHDPSPSSLSALFVPSASAEQSSCGNFVRHEAGVRSAAATNPHIKLALTLVRYRHGPFLTKVLNNLFLHGPRTLSQMESDMSDIPRPKLQRAMITLLRYDLIEPTDQYAEWLAEYELRDRKKSKVKPCQPFRWRAIQYRAALQNCLRLNRHGHFLAIILKHYSPDPSTSTGSTSNTSSSSSSTTFNSEQNGRIARRMLKLFLEQGRLSGLEACELLTEALDAKAHFQTREECAQAAVAALQSLLGNRFLEPVPQIVLTAAQQATVDEAERKLRAGGPGTGESLHLRPQSVSLVSSSVPAPASSLSSSPSSLTGKRKFGLASSSSTAHSVDSMDEQSKRLRTESTDQLFAQLTGIAKDPDVLLRIRGERFELEILKAEVLRLAREKYDESAKVMEIILNMCGDSLLTKQGSLTQFTRERIAQAMADRGVSLSGGNHMLDMSLNLFVSDSSRMLVQKHGEYSVDFPELVTWMAKKHVESVLQGRYKIDRTSGAESTDRFAHRLWSVLYEKKMLDEKQLQDMAMVPQKVVRVLLYQLLKDNLVFVQEVPKSKERSQARQKLFYWTVDLDRSRLQLAMDCSRSIRNLLIRREADLMGARPHKRADAAFQNARDELATDDPHEQRKMLHELAQKEKIIEQTIFRLDRTLLHLTYFLNGYPRVD